MNRIFQHGKFTTFPDIHRHVDMDLPLEDKPAFGQDPKQAATYSIMSDYFFQIADMYGSQRVDPDLLRVAAGEDTLTGCGWVSYFECWNEPDRWWGKAEAHFTPYELAAMTSVAYDGHQSSMGVHMGMKNADPEAKLVLGGLTSLDLQYMDAMRLWSNHHREGSFPADVLNFHHYCNSAGNQHQPGHVYGVSPEADGLRERLITLVRWRDRYMPEKEIWLSEFCWDTYESSSQSSIGHALYPGEVDLFYLQAIWLVRGYLEGAASGIDHMFMYLINDLGDDGLYRNCGLVYQDYTPKLSWYFVSTLKSVLTDTYFSGIMESGHEAVRMYKFEDPDSGRVVLALWCPTSDGSRVEEYKVDIPGITSTVNLVELAKGEKEGFRSGLEPVDGSVRISISEQPVFLELLSGNTL